jgi:hypothetical protein
MAGMTGSTEPGPPTEPNGPGDPDEPPAPTKTRDGAEPLDAAQPADTGQPVDAPQTVETADPVDAARPVETADPVDTGQPSRIAGETGPPLVRRRLANRPGDRFRRGPSDDGTAVARGSPVRAIALGVMGAVIGIAIFLVLAIGFSFTAGLVIVAVFTGRFVGLFVRAGAAGSLASPARALLSIVIFLGALSLVLLITWFAARSEGGVLPLGDYLEQAYGTPIVALEYMLGTLMAWWSAR